MGNSGYVVESVPLVLYGVQQIISLGFKELLEELVLCGGDTDTMCSIAGQIGGALIGRCGLPEDIVTQIANFKDVVKIAEDFSQTIQQFITKNS